MPKKFYYNGPPLKQLFKTKNVGERRGKEL
jgi:hypothetical protein